MLVHLSSAAQAFGSLRNISAATGEMAHRIYKNMVPHTNRHDLPRDLTVWESQAQVLHFSAEGCAFDDIMHSSSLGKGPADLLKLRVFSDVYIKESSSVLDDYELQTCILQFA